MPQQIIWGLEALSEIIKGKKILLVKDASFPFLPCKSFFDAFDTVDFSEFTPNPLYEQVVSGVSLFNREHCEMIIAIGGGSTIDVAKCIKLYSKMDPAENYLDQEPFDTGIPLVAIPTTAGTGSESTRHAVIYYEGAKQSISHPSIVPDYAVLETSVLKTLPLYQKKCTMLDALCQGIESWWSVNSTPESMEYSRETVERILANWESYIFENDECAAKEIMLAANFSGRAINITATTAAHAMSYKLTSLYHLPHGHAVAVSMREIWGHMLTDVQNWRDPRGDEYLRAVFSEILERITPAEFNKMLDRMEITGPHSENREADLKILADSVNPIRLKNNPVDLSHETLYEMYERIVN